MPLKKDNATKTVGMVMIIMLIGKLTGLYRDILLSAAYGTDTIEAKAFTFASNIPTIFLDFAFAAAISSSFIPVFNSYLEKRDKKQAFDLANNFITIVIILSGIFTVLGILFATPIVNIFASFSYETKTLSAQLLKIMILTVILSGTAFSLTGVLQSLGEFNIPAAMSITSNCIIIFYYIFLIDKFGVFGLAVTFIIGWLTQILVQIPSLIKKGYRFKPFINMKDSGLREIGLLMLPVLVSSWVMPINVLVNQKVASTLFDNAGYTVISKANQLYSVITGIFILSIANVIFPKFAKQKAADDKTGFSDTMRETISGMMFFLIPMMFGLFVLSEPIVRLLFEYGKFDVVSTQRTGLALKFYSVGMVGFGLQTILSRGFYAAKDGKTPMITGIIAIALNLILSYGTIAYFGIGGPAFAASVSINATGLIMFFVMGKQNKGMFTKKMGFNLLKMVACSVVMAAAAYFSMNYIISNTSDGTISRFIIIAVPVTIGFILYMACAFFLKIDEAKMVFGYIREVEPKEH